MFYVKSIVLNETFSKMVNFLLQGPQIFFYERKTNYFSVFWRASGQGPEVRPPRYIFDTPPPLGGRASGFLPLKRAKSGLFNRLGWARLGRDRLGYVRIGQVTLGQVRLRQDRLCQDGLGQITLGQDVRLGQVRLDYVRLGCQVRLGQDTLGQVRIRQVRICKVRLDWVMLV